jgi:hypothetical protein
MESFVNLKKIAALTICVMSMQICHAATIPYTDQTAPDALSRSILAFPLSGPADGATSGDDIPAAINRNFPKLIEFNVASMPSSTMSWWVDQLSDLELEHLAQLYVNANADAGRSGELLKVAALRLDGAHLGRLSIFFGHAEVRSAVAKMAPAKLDSFEANSSVSFVAPIVGAALSMPDYEGVVGDGAKGMQGFKPQVSMTFEQLYTGFRSMQVGSMATPAAIYETAMFAGKNLGAAGYLGWQVGSWIDSAMRAEAPDFYYGTFVNVVGGPVTYATNLVNAVATDLGNAQTLGQLQANNMVPMGISQAVSNSMGATGGDWSMEGEYADWIGGGGCKVRSACNGWPQ